MSSAVFDVATLLFSAWVDGTGSLELSDDRFRQDFESDRFTKSTDRGTLPGGRVCEKEKISTVNA